MAATELEEKHREQRETSRQTAKEQIENLETELTAAKKQFEFLACYLCLTLVHAFAFFKFIVISFRWNSPIPAWIAAGGIGSFAVWFSWTARPLSERLLIGLSAIALVFLASSTSIPYYAETQRADKREQLSQFVAQYGGGTYADIVLVRSYGPTQAKVSFQMLRGWLLGSFLAAYCCTWFSGFRLAPFGRVSLRRPLSIRAIFSRHSSSLSLASL